jgi:hypothetical protein
MSKNLGHSFEHLADRLERLNPTANTPIQSSFNVSSIMIGLE